MARYSPQITAVPSRKYTDLTLGYSRARPRAPRPFAPAVDDPLLALELELTKPPSTINAHGKPLGGVSIFGSRRAPARRAAFRTPPR